MQISHTIAEMLDYSYKFNLYYLNLLDKSRLHEPLTVNGVEGNSAYWLVGHLAWAEADLVQEILGEKALPIPWIRHFAMKLMHEKKEDLPDVPTLMQEFERVHQRALELIRQQTDEDLEKPTFVVPSNWHTTRKKALYHSIRHQSCHTGQLALMAKAHGAPTP